MARVLRQWRTAPSGASSLEGDALGLRSVNGYGKSHGGQLDPDSAYDPILHERTLVRNMTLNVSAWSFSPKYEEQRMARRAGSPDKELEFIVLQLKKRVPPSEVMPIVYGTSSMVMVLRFQPVRAWTVYVRRTPLNGDIYMYEYFFTITMRISISGFVAQVYTYQYRSKSTKAPHPLPLKLVLDPKKVAPVAGPYEPGQRVYHPQLPTAVHGMLYIEETGKIVGEETTWIRCNVKALDLHVTADMLVHLREAKRAQLQTMTQRESSVK